MKAGKKASVILMMAIMMSSCGGSKVSMDDVVNYYGAKGYDGNVKKDSSITKDNKLPYEEMGSFNNLKSVLEKMKLYGYFQNNVDKRNFTLGPDQINQICGYGIFNPFYLIIQKRNDSYSDFGKFPENQYFKISTTNNQGGYSSYYCNDSVLNILNEINAKISSGEFKVPESKNEIVEKADSSLLVGQAFNIMELEKSNDNALHFPLQIIPVGSGFLWVEGNVTKDFIQGRLEYAGVGYSLYYFDKNGFLNWSDAGVNSISPEDRYAINGFKTSADTLALLIQHNVATYDANGKRELCYEVYIQKYDLKAGKTIGRQTITKHFNKDYKDAFQNRIPKGLEQKPEKYFMGDENYTDEGKTLVQSFVNTDFMSQFKKSEENGEFQYTSESKFDHNRPFKILQKKLKEITASSPSIDRYFSEYDCISYSDISKKYVAIAMGKNFWQNMFYYIKVIEQDGKSKPIVLKTKN